MDIKNKNTKTSKTSKTSKDTSSDLTKAFVSKHLAKQLRARGLMVGNNGSLEKIKEILANHYILLVNKIQEVALLAKKKIVRPEFVETGQSML